MKKFKIEYLLIFAGICFLGKILLFPPFSIYTKYATSDNQITIDIEKDRVYTQKFIANIDFFHKLSIIYKKKNSDGQCEIYLKLNDENNNEISNNKVSIDKHAEQFGYAYLNFSDIKTKESKHVLLISSTCDNQIQLYGYENQVSDDDNKLYVDDVENPNNIVLKIEGKKKNYSDYIYPIMTILISSLSLEMNYKKGVTNEKKNKKNSNN